MEIMQILFKQIFLMFIYMMIGFTLYKKKMITKQGSKELATLLLYVILPMAIIKPFMIEFDYEKLAGLGKSFVIAVVALALSMLVAKLFFGKKHPMENFCAAFSNAGFIGIPLTQMALGEEAVFYIAIFVALLTVLQWTYGVMIITGDKSAVSPKKIVTNPIVIAVVIGIFEAIIQYRQNKSAEREPEWMEEMQEYIQGHYQDCNMNVTSLAQEFGISVPHVSRSFKNFRDYGVLEYIHKVRLEHAKDMLKNDVRIKNIALDVGYTDAQAFTRAFKRYEGITPSQYKELISKNEA